MQYRLKSIKELESTPGVYFEDGAWKMMGSSHCVTGFDLKEFADLKISESIYKKLSSWKFESKEFRYWMFIEINQVLYDMKTKYAKKKVKLKDNFDEISCSFVSGDLYGEMLDLLDEFLEDLNRL